QVAYLPIDPHDIGRDYQAVIRVNSQSGKGGVAFVLERDYGLVLPRWLQVELAQHVQQASESDGGALESAAIHALFREHFMAEQGAVTLRGYRLERDERDHIEVRLQVDGQEQVLQGEGDGAISAFIDAWARHSGRQLSVVDYQEHALGTGTDAQAIAYVQMNIDRQRVSGAAIDNDTVSASLKAVLAVLNRERRQHREVA
ncbi:MAG TPA: alpha-isopropylmalate synthase regulatory domain-containing protein, partial [Gammaproteobacteria bacterium]|nr:alpha-isopropylmalate synthase regulatory domain-containing protein [Gammaproteobacteria bacterium]